MPSAIFFKYPLNIVFVSFLLLLVDIFSKNLASRYMEVLCNSGVAFGFGSNGGLVSAGALVVVFWLFTRAGEKGIKWGLLLVFSGGLSNLIDRVFSGCIRDFISVLGFASFNLADIAITAGVFLIMYDLVIGRKSRERKRLNEGCF